MIPKAMQQTSYKKVRSSCFMCKFILNVNHGYIYNINHVLRREWGGNNQC